MKENLILDISKAVKHLLIHDPFYGLFISGINKIETNKVPLAAVGLNKATMEFCLMINPEEWFKYSPEVKVGVMKHETLHLTEFHLLTAEDYPNDKMDNIACDFN